MASKCIWCGEEIKDDHPRIITKRGDVCMGCEGEEIPVYKTEITGEGGGYFDTEPPTSLLEDMSEGYSYTVSKQKMSLVQYANLEEFTGF